MMVDVLKSGGKLLVTDLYLPKDCSVLSKCAGILFSKIYSYCGFNLLPPVKTPKNTKEIVSRRYKSNYGLTPYYKIFKKD